MRRSRFPADGGYGADLAGGPVEHAWLPLTITVTWDISVFPLRREAVPASPRNTRRKKSVRMRTLFFRRPGMAAGDLTSLVAGDLGVRADVVERAREDRDEHGARVGAGHRGAVVSTLPGGEGADNEPDCQDDGAESHQFPF